MGKPQGLSRPCIGSASTSDGSLLPDLESKTDCWLSNGVYTFDRTVLQSAASFEQQLHLTK